MLLVLDPIIFRQHEHGGKKKLGKFAILSNMRSDPREI